MTYFVILIPIIAIVLHSMCKISGVSDDIAEEQYEEYKV